MLPAYLRCSPGGIVAYDNVVKRQVLGVQSETLEKHGAVSEQTAREMAEGIRGRLGILYGLSTTGIAGPGGGSDDKPVGLVYMAVAGPHGTDGLSGYVFGIKRADSLTRRKTYPLALVSYAYQGHRCRHVNTWIELRMCEFSVVSTCRSSSSRPNEGRAGIHSDR